MAPSREYWAVSVSLDAAAPEGEAAVDAVTNFLAEAGALGVVEEGDGAPRRLLAFFPPGTDPEREAGRLAEYLEALRTLQLPVGPGTIAVTPVAEEAWADAWRAHFRPLAVGRRLLVTPPWEAAGDRATPPEATRRVEIVIEPGRAFGTGGHGTTQGCLELLERAVESTRPGSALDAGTGSGILAIAAARLGVPRVQAIDVDPDAVAAAQANALQNGVAEQVVVCLGSVEEWRGPASELPACELVIANLLASALVTLAPVLARCVTVPGQLVAGGLLVHEVPVVVASFVPYGFRLVELTEHEGWGSVLLARGRV